MTKAGYDCIKIAKQNGTWTNLDQVEALVIPKDLNEQLINCKEAIQYFSKLSKSDKKILLHWVVSAKREVTRQKRVQEIVENASKNLKPKQFR